MERHTVELLLERTFLFDPNIYMVVVMTLEGDVGTEELCEAVKKAYTQNSMTMSKAVLDENGTLTMEEMEETGCKVFVDNRDWQEIMNENERIPFRINEGELVRTFIIPREKETDVFFMIHHITCDGNAIFLLAEDVMSNLQGKEVAYRKSRVMTKDEAIKKGGLNFIQKSGLKKLSQSWQNEKKIFNWDDYYKVHKEYWKDKKTEITFKEIVGSELENVREECKKYGVTVNSYMVTKLMENYTGTIKLGIPTSVRGEDRSISCLVSSVLEYAKYDHNKSFEANVKKVNKILKNALQNDGSIYYIPQFVAFSDPTLLDAAYLQNCMGNECKAADTMRKVLGLYGEERIILGVTNLGVVSIPADYEKFKVTRVIPVAPHIATSETVFTISTFNGRMLIAENNIAKK